MQHLFYGKVNEINIKIIIHKIQGRVRFWCIFQLIRNDPQMLYPLIKLFESKSCDFTVQVNLFTFVHRNKNYLHLKNHS
jgi:hypothetical protein